MIYDLRFTIYDLEIRRAAGARKCEALAEVVGKITQGSSSKGAGLCEAVSRAWLNPYSREPEASHSSKS